jgi:2-methylcitrate dehydratase PrpD
VVELAPRPIEIKRFDVLGWDGSHAEEPLMHARLDVSSGTYIRAIARDLGRDAGSGAHLVALRRVGSGVFAVGEAHTMQQIAAAALAMEVTSRLSTATGGLRSGKDAVPRRVWGLTSNSIGGTAGAANLLGLDAHKMLHALGTSAYYAPLATHTKFNYTVEQGYAKYGPAGWMAQGAVTTTLLAEMGYHGDTSFLEGDYGFYVQNGADNWNPDTLTVGLGRDWVFMNVGFKP